MDYNLTRKFADSWGLLAMALFSVAFVFRPGSRRQVDEASQIPLKDD
ncbi:nitrogen fixation protein fixq [Mesorhizobium tianshanense]|uniref:Cytochrome c oxidase cbb3-type subunit 4 n=1 Tax=Mesorhizobium tianshanense TaxID=39844 RepID=A0A562N4A5_9HYPH|nr:cbb3-type cytochrome c oxidase subunit 3 [Mesorhizobium tianshanense]TWI26995.1 cytochrome c oxidase cbb3-type subunit 4 [Mesorhizobium tianshanense]GLS35473.1 nitrogen fixation protein fixq [Mesorhizobium tianshanense]